MFTRISTVFVLTALFCSIGCSHSKPMAKAEPSDTLTVMSYNLRFASNTPPNAWPDRRPLVKECIQLASPDVIGTQEGVYHQLRELASDLPEYEWIGIGRDGGSRGEFMAVFYRKGRLQPLEYDHYWLSDTPMVMGSKTWGPRLPRMVTWVKFRDQVNGKEFYFINTHFDHEVQTAREKAAELLRQRVQLFNPDLPVILTGDFNATATQNKAYDILTADGFFADTWFTAPKRIGDDVATFNSFKGITPNGPHIDWILTRGKVTPVATQILTYTRDSQFPSDHFPLITWMKL